MLQSLGGRKRAVRYQRDPGRVEVGKAAALSERHISKSGQQVRSSHLGYDCYRTGAINGHTRLRCILRPARLPPHIPTDAALILPNEMWWPEADHVAGHAMIDAVLRYDRGLLATWKGTWPEHEFGFERFMEHAERRAAAVRAGEATPITGPPPRVDPRAAAPMTVPTGTIGLSERAPITRNPRTGHALAATDVLGQRSIGGGRPLPRAVALFPGELIELGPKSVTPYDGYTVSNRVARFNDGTSALRVTIRGDLPDGTSELCSQAYVDLMDGRFEIVQHFPGRLHALNLPEDLLYQVLGVKARAPHRQEHRPHRSPPTRGAVTRAHAALAPMMTTGHADAEPAIERRPRRPDHPEPAPAAPEPAPERPAAEHVGTFEQEADGTTLERFPAAPTGPRPQDAPQQAGRP